MDLILAALSPSLLALVEGSLSNDEVSSDEEMLEYFISNGLTEKQARQALTYRDQYLNNIYLDGFTPITAVEVFGVKQSMRNGGGPACLRLRVALNDDELHAINRGVILTDALYERLTSWVEAHYRDQLSQQDLADPMLLEEVRKALDELTGILGLGSIYDFQL